MVMAVNNDEDHGNIIFLYVLIGRPVEVKYTADLFLLSSQENLKTSKKLPLAHWLTCGS